MVFIAARIIQPLLQAHHQPPPFFANVAHSHPQAQPQALAQVLYCEALRYVLVNHNDGVHNTVNIS